MRLPDNMDLRGNDYGRVVSRVAHATQIDERAGPERKNGPWRNQDTYAAGSIAGKKGATLGIGIRIVIGNDCPQPNGVTSPGFVSLQAVRRVGRGKGGQRFPWRVGLLSKCAHGNRRHDERGFELETEKHSPSVKCTPAPKHICVSVLLG